MFAGDGPESIVTLVDTSVWINHLRRGDNQLRALLERGEVLCHPFIIGELACGSMANRTEVLELLRAGNRRPNARVFNTQTRRLDTHPRHLDLRFGLF